MGVASGRATYEAATQGFEWENLTAATLKRKSEPVSVWQAVAPLARFGRDVTRHYDTVDRP
jgi:hypothetical protein